MKIEFYKHNINDSDIKHVNNVLKSIFITNAHITKQFEKQFSQYMGIEHCVAVNSGTAALHLSLVALGIGKGDEVITTPLTFIATANTILYTGATPVFVDVEEKTGNIDAKKIEEKITDKTKAIIPVHLFGNMSAMIAIKQIAQKYNLKVIEDSAHCLEGQRDGVRPGQLSDSACFSFYATKNITSGEGGAIVCHDEALSNKLQMLRLHGIDKDAGSRYQNKYQHWDMKILGFKYNMSDIQSALLIGQLERIEYCLEKRNKIATFYANELAEAKIKYIQIAPNTKSARHLFPILVNNRDEMLAKLQKNGIGVAVHYNPVHLHTYYQKEFNYRKGDYPIAERLGSKLISIPLYPDLTEKEYKYIVNELKKNIQEHSK